MNIFEVVYMHVTNTKSVYCKQSKTNNLVENFWNIINANINEHQYWRAD